WMIQGGADLLTVRDALGHSDAKLTQRYAHVGKTKVAEALHRLGEALTDTPLAQPILKKAAND
ncbi:MAG: hypothetical protein WCP68_17720, partial [Enhydrobacter sp.]